MSSRKKKAPPPASSSTTPSAATPNGSKAKKKKESKFWFDKADPFYIYHNGLSFIIRGKPLPQQRPKWGSGRLFPPSKKDQIDFNSTCQELFAAKQMSIPSVKDKVDVILELRYGFAAQKQKEQHIWSCADVDNLCKFTLDAMGYNRTFYHDDRQVTKVSMEKCFDTRYGGRGFTRVHLTFKSEVPAASEIIVIDE